MIGATFEVIEVGADKLPKMGEVKLTFDNFVYTPAAQKEYEEHFIQSLQSVVANHDNKFPDDFSLKGLRTDEETMEGIIIDGLANWMLDICFNVSNDWHYAGKGASLDDEDRPVMWYRPRGKKDVYRVIDATLEVKEVAVGELPKIEAVKITYEQFMNVPALEAAVDVQP